MDDYGGWGSSGDMSAGLGAGGYASGGIDIGGGISVGGGASGGAGAGGYASGGGFDAGYDSYDGGDGGWSDGGWTAGDSLYGQGGLADIGAIGGDWGGAADAIGGGWGSVAADVAGGSLSGGGWSDVADAFGAVSDGSLSLGVFDAPAPIDPSRGLEQFGATLGLGSSALKSAVGKTDFAGDFKLGSGFYADSHARTAGLPGNTLAQKPSRGYSEIAMEPASVHPQQTLPGAFAPYYGGQFGLLSKVEGMMTGASPSTPALSDLDAMRQSIMADSLARSMRGAPQKVTDRLGPAEMTYTPAGALPAGPRAPTIDEQKEVQSLAGWDEYSSTGKRMDPAKMTVKTKNIQLGAMPSEFRSGPAKKDKDQSRIPVDVKYDWYTNTWRREPYVDIKVDQAKQMSTVTRRTKDESRIPVQIAEKMQNRITKDQSRIEPSISIVGTASYGAGTGLHAQATIPGAISAPSSLNDIDMTVLEALGTTGAALPSKTVNFTASRQRYADAIGGDSNPVASFEAYAYEQPSPAEAQSSYEPKPYLWPPFWPTYGYRFQPESGMYIPGTDVYNMMIGMI